MSADGGDDGDATAGPRTGRAGRRRRRRRRTSAPASSAVWTVAAIALAVVVVIGGGGGVLAYDGGGTTATTGVRTMAPCAHLGDETNDVSARAYASDVVFEGKVRSKGPVRPGAGTYGVTFVVQRVHKDAMQAVTYEGLRAGAPVRLYFRAKPRPHHQRQQQQQQHRQQSQQQQRRPSARRGTGPAQQQQCVQRFAPAAGGQTVEADIKRGAKYLVFVAGVGPHNLSVLGEPVLRTPKNVDAVRRVLCRNCSE